MTLNKKFLSSTSSLAIQFYWRLRGVDLACNKNGGKIVSTYHLALFSIVSKIVFTQPVPTGLEKFDIVSNIQLPLRTAVAIDEVGYVRPMKSHDVIEGSSAKPGWCGYFAADGDIVFWERDFSSGIWDISGVTIYFQQYLH